MNDPNSIEWGISMVEQEGSNKRVEFGLRNNF